ncbi:vitamin K epoxide reductase family protein [Candidatus Woesearchaeota archaeon]|nr:vitamin K epoxide reductase family protein [Candidatus Woesearchaeota archaeon]
MELKKAGIVGLTLVMDVNLLLSLWLGTKKSICLPNGGGCSGVQASSYATLLGLPVTYYGIAFFLLMSTLLLLSLREGLPSFILDILFAAGGVFALYLLLVQFFVLHELCGVCQIIDWLTVAAAVAWFWVFRYHTSEQEKMHA